MVNGVAFDRTWSFLRSWLRRPGQLVATKWLANYMQPDMLFDLACEGGHTKTARWLLMSKEDIDTHHDDDYCFRAACGFGRLETAMWLLSLGGVQDRARNDFPLFTACSNGRLQIAMWLAAMMGIMDTRLCTRLLYWACKGGHLATAKWLVARGGVQIIHGNQDDIFEAACTAPRKNTAWWLMSLDPDWPWPETYVRELQCTMSHARVAWMKAVLAACVWTRETKPHTLPKAVKL